MSNHQWGKKRRQMWISEIDNSVYCWFSGVMFIPIMKKSQFCNLAQNSTGILFFWNIGRKMSSISNAMLCKMVKHFSQQQEIILLLCVVCVQKLKRVQKCSFFIYIQWAYFYVQSFHTRVIFQFYDRQNICIWFAKLCEVCIYRMCERRMWLVVMYLCALIGRF